MQIYSNINDRFAYKPYSGGAGPTDEQREQFDRLLASVISAHGVKYRIVNNGIDNCVFVGDRGIGYDRWGYTSFDGSLDQVDLQTAVLYLLENV